MEKKQKKLSIYFLIVSVIIVFVVIFVVNQNHQEHLLFEGSPQYIHKTTQQQNQLMVGLTAAPSESRTYLGDNQISKLTTRLVYEPLLYIKKDLSIEYGLAKAVDFSKDGLEATIQLKDAQFSNGEHIKSQDIKDAFLELYKATSTYAYKDLYNNIAGLQDYQLQQSKDISGITIENDRTIKIKFNTCSITNIQTLTMPIFKLTGDSQFAIGTGEYAFNKYSHNHSIELQKNQYAHLSDYKYEKIILKSMSTMEMKDNINQYNIDVFEISLDMSMDDIKDAKYHNIYEMKDAYYLNYLEFNLNDVNGSNKNTRKAMTLAIDQEKFKVGFDAQEKTNYSCLTSLMDGKSAFNLSQAKDSYQGNTNDISYYTLSDTVSTLRYDTIKSCLDAANISVKKSSHKDTTFQYSNHQLTSPINEFEEKIIQSSLKQDYEKKLCEIYTKDCRNVFYEIEDYLCEEYIIIPISTRVYGLVVSSDLEQEKVIELMINS